MGPTVRRGRGASASARRSASPSTNVGVAAGDHRPSSGVRAAGGVPSVGPRDDVDEGDDAVGPRRSAGARRRVHRRRAPRRAGRGAWPAATATVRSACSSASSAWSAPARCGGAARHPVVVTLIGIAVFAVTLVPVTVAVGLFSLAVRRRDRVLAVMTLVVAATFAVAEPATPAERWAAAVVLGLLEAGFCAAAGVVRRGPARPRRRAARPGGPGRGAAGAAGRAGHARASGRGSPARCTTCWPTRCR